MKTIKFFAIVALFLGFSVNAMAQNTANVDASASANLIKPISIKKNLDLLFGDIILNGSAASTVVLSALNDSPVAYTGDAAAYASTSPRQRAKFTVDGEENAKYSITIKDGAGGTGEANKVTLSKGGDNMVVDLVQNKEAADNVISATAAQNEIFVGGTLNIKANQALGAYTGTFNVTVAYE